VVQSTTTETETMSTTVVSEPVTTTTAATTPGVSSALTATGGTASEAAAGESTLLLAYTLINHDFVNRDGEVSGHVNDLVLNLRTGSILFAEIEYGGFLDIGDTELLIPLRTLQWRSVERDILLNLDETVLTTYPDLTVGSPRLDDPDWYDGLEAFWNDAGFGNTEVAATGFDPATDVIVRASDLLGYSLVDLGAGIGRIHNLLIDMEQSRAPYLLVGFGPTAADDDAYMLPFTVVDVVDVESNQITLDTNLSQEILLTAPRFDRSLFQGEIGAIDPALVSAADAFWEETGLATTQ
ncbi:MAG: PRC-barrel domain-containing protein, partial [Caldilineaceae bacterium]|nr:PRC-barrel domain-containing protein [Caldilineaceae bacterium]